MNKLFLLKNPELFQGEGKINNNKCYFEGWYFKITSKNGNIAIIPGVNINEKDKKAFIQIITNDQSYYFNYDIKGFKYSHNPFKIEIEKNIFTLENIKLDIFENKTNIVANIEFSDHKNIKTSLISPNIMGPFSYIPSMECNHAIISMKNKVNGKIKINGKNLRFYLDNGYIEKDWGTSFPKSYIWCQANDFEKSKASFMCSVADIPFKFITFKGVICILKTNDKEYRFTTYNNSKIEKSKFDENFIDIILKNGRYTIYIRSQCNTPLKLKAPVNGEMKKSIYESIASKTKIVLRKGDDVIFSDLSKNCGLEIVI